jgi:hypothetical protein
MLLEKAWAKLHDDYESIESGNTLETHRDLLGVPGRYSSISNWTKLETF